MLTADLDISPLLAKLRKVSALTNADMKGLVRQQAGILIADGKTGLIGITPPQNDKLRGMAGKRAGEGSVMRDVNRVYGSPSKLYDAIKAKSQPAARAFWAHVQRKRWTEANDIAERVTGHRLREFDDGAEHSRRRVRATGRVAGKTPTRFITEMKHVKRYIREKQKNVGLLASGWYVAGQRAGLAMRGVPAWVQRHTRGSGFAFPNERADAYSLTLGNSTPYGKDSDMRRRMRFSLNARVNATRRRLPFLIKHALAQAQLQA
jgi:hypothetical protein